VCYFVIHWRLNFDAGSKIVAFLVGRRGRHQDSSRAGCGSQADVVHHWSTHSVLCSSVLLFKTCAQSDSI